MNEINPDIALLLHIARDLYRKPLVKPPTINEVNIPRVCRLSIENKLGFYASETLIIDFGEQLDKKSQEILKKFVSSCKNKIEELKETTSLLTKCLDDYVVVKTFRGYDVIPNDIDVLVPQISAAVKKLRTRGKVKLLESEPNQLMVLIGGQKVHLHDKISWADSIFLDDDLITTDPRTVKLWNVEVKIPNVNADFLIYLAHMNFEPLHFTLSDLIYASKVAPQLNWSIVFNQAKKYHWIRTLTQTIILLDSFHHTLYPEPCPFKGLNLPHNLSEANSILFPKSIPRWLIVNAFIEKRAFGYLTQKLSKSIQVLATGDAYSDFYVPPEQTINNRIGDANIGK